MQLWASKLLIVIWYTFILEIWRLFENRLHRDSKTKPSTVEFSTFKSSKVDGDQVAVASAEVIVAFYHFRFQVFLFSLLWECRLIVSQWWTGVLYITLKHSFRLVYFYRRRLQSFSISSFSFTATNSKQKWKQKIKFGNLMLPSTILISRPCCKMMIPSRQTSIFSVSCFSWVASGPLWLHEFVQQ